MTHNEQFFIRLDGKLRDVFGIPEHRCDEPTDALVRGIISQNTTDLNRDRAFFKLKHKFPEWHLLLSASDDEVADAIRVAGMANLRTKRIKKMLLWLQKANNGNIDASFLLKMPHRRAMKVLTSVPGIGTKTAAVFLLFCANAPYFPVDTHIRRIMMRLGVFPPKTSAEVMIKTLSDKIPSEIHYTLHLNLIELGRKFCTARKAMCEKCPVIMMCRRQI